MPETNKKTKTKGLNTKQKILRECRKLFNEKNPNSVTTAEIAASLGIREGNLQYHFPKKEYILEALFEEFKENLTVIASAYQDYQSPEDYIDYLPSWFNMIWQWRFYYRDPATVHRIAPSLMPRLKSLSKNGRLHIQEVLKREQEYGLIEIPEGQLDSVIANAWIVWSHWFDYLSASHGISKPTQKHMTWGVHQVNNIFAPYYTKKGRDLFGICEK